MQTIIHLPVRKHIKHFLTITHGEHLLLSERGYMPCLILSKLRKPDKKNAWEVKPGRDLVDGVNYVAYPVYLSSNYFNKYGSYISEEDIVRFNDAVDDLIREYMLLWIHHPGAEDMVVDYQIQKFLDFYGFGPDVLPFDNLKRWYYRHRERLEKRLAALEPFKPELILKMKADQKGNSKDKTVNLTLFNLTH